MIVLAELDLASPRFQTRKGLRAFEQVRELCTELAAGAADRDASGHFPASNFARFRDARLLGLQVPEKYGGIGLTPDEYCIAIAQMAVGDASTALAYNMHSSALISLSKLGSDELTSD